MCRVFGATNGGEGLQFSAAHSGKIQLLVSDLMMPVVCGRKLAGQLLREWPGLKVP